MFEERFFYEVAEGVPIRQGDVIRADDQSGDGSPIWAVIVTADCDIAQGKMGSFFTCLEVVTATDYIGHYWAADELSKLRKKYEDRAISLIHSADVKHNPEAQPISPADLADWVGQDGAEGVVQLLSMTRGAETECVQALRIVAAAQVEDKTELDRLKDVWCLLKRTKKDQDGAMRGAVRPSQMRSDYILLPALPAEREIGFVVLLRSIRSISPNKIHPSRLSLRISGERDGFYRIGRLKDFLRYSISQKWTSLYSRIGMTDNFESECETAAEIIFLQM